jgi:hypothetical protein
MDKKNQLSNVAFGGNWSEEILVNDELSKILNVIERAVQDCMERDVEDEALLNAMLYVRKNIEKGPMLCAAFFKAIRIENQGLRYTETRKVELMIRSWAGVE